MDENVQHAYVLSNAERWNRLQDLYAPVAEALAEAVESNAVIESLVVDVAISRQRDFWAALVFSDASILRLSDAFAKNISLTQIHLYKFSYANEKILQMKRYCTRNRQLRKVCFALAQLAKPSDAFSSLKDANVRQEVFSFFLPRDCTPANIFQVLGMMKNAKMAFM